jgi:hypothetical protein
MSSPSCERVCAQLPPFLGGELDAAGAAVVRQHLLGCHACRGEAAAFQRALGGLHALAQQPVAGVDEAFFAKLHGAIVADCAACEPLPTGAMRGWRWGLAALAAAALVAVGFWCGHDRAVSVWDRPPLGTSTAFTEPTAVPYAGPRVPLRLLGDDAPAEARSPGDAGAGTLDPGSMDSGSGDVARGVGSGLRARDRLRSLVDDGMLLPPRQSRDR